MAWLALVCLALAWLALCVDLLCIAPHNVSFFVYVLRQKRREVDSGMLLRDSWKVVGKEIAWKAPARLLGGTFLNSRALESRVTGWGWGVGWEGIVFAE